VDQQPSSCREEIDEPWSLFTEAVGLVKCLTADLKDVKASMLKVSDSSEVGFACAQIT
jgi:hypothetical protein